MTIFLDIAADVLSTLRKTCLCAVESKLDLKEAVSEHVAGTGANKES
jgi:hypothetical protein